MIAKNEATKQKIKDRDRQIMEKTSLMRMKAELEKEKAREAQLARK